ncbi:MAG: peptidase S8 [Planctomycetes bacterium]|nr:peptidase S8 [Planctomycetota bacterium]
MVRNIAACLALAALGGTAAAQSHGEFRAGEVLVKFRPEAHAAAEETIEQLRATVIGDLAQIGVRHLRLPEALPVEFVVLWLSGLPHVEFAEPNFLVEAFHVPNDPSYGSQWGPPKIACEAAWDLETGAASTVIAIVDTGVDKNHGDLAAKLLPGYDFVNNDSDPDDDNGHGTHCAGIAAARTNNGVGIAGVGYDCSVMPVKVLNSGGSGAWDGVANGINWAADNGADVISMSLGGSSGSSTVEAAVNYAWGLNVLVVAAAGNSGSTAPSYPAWYANCIAVASTDSNDTRSSFSNYGSWVDVAAPGRDIYATYDGNSYATLSGTSMACPHVAGEAGLLWSNLGTATAVAVIRARIEDNCDNVGTFVTHGRVNCNLALLDGGGGGGSRTDWAPTSYTILQGSNYSGGLSNLATSDDGRLEIAAAKASKDYYCDWYGSTVATYSGTLSSVEVKLESNYTSSSTCTVYLWNWTSSTWVSIGSTSLGTTDTTTTFTVASPAAYVSGTGEIRARSYGTRRGKTFRHRTDQLLFTVVTL